jgi:hypothetical protein
VSEEEDVRSLPLRTDRHLTGNNERAALMRKPVYIAVISHPFTLLVLFGLLFHTVVALILGTRGLPVSYFPRGLAALAGILVLSMPVCSSGTILLLQIMKDGAGVFFGVKPPALKNRLREAAYVAGAIALLGFMYCIVLIAYLNLKPAIPMLHAQTYDGVLELLERNIFGGVLPTEVAIKHSSYTAIKCWNVVYGLFTPFMFISVALAIRYRGFSGGALLTLAYAIGLMVSILLTLLFPTLGPLFTHPEWFTRFSALPSNDLAAFLTRTVEEYGNSPGTIYACGGISAMPSYHIFACFCGLVYWRYLPIVYGFLGATAVLLIWVSTFVLGWHYVLDGFAAILLALPLMVGLERIQRCSVRS